MQLIECHFMAVSTESLCSVKFFLTWENFVNNQVLSLTPSNSIHHCLLIELKAVPFTDEQLLKICLLYLFSWFTRVPRHSLWSFLTLKTNNANKC